MVFNATFNNINQLYRGGEKGKCTIMKYESSC